MMTELKFRENGRFRIVQFTDIHWQNGEPVDQKSAVLMKNIVQSEVPDLVVLTGDILSGGGCDDAAVSMRQIVKIMENCGVAWTVVFGNHDDEGTASRHDLMSVMQEGDLSVVEPGPADVPGVGNFVLTIQHCNDNSPAALLYFVDSGSYAMTDIGGYDWIKREQIEWFLSESVKHNVLRENPLPALAFFHIPLPEYHEVWDFHTCYGAKYEDICAPRVNTGFLLRYTKLGM